MLLADKDIRRTWSSEKNATLDEAMVIFRIPESEWENVNEENDTQMKAGRD